MLSGDGTGSAARPERSPATVLALALLCVLGLQAGLALHDARRAAELRDALSESHALALALERRIGYGGLIHAFKNYVLRPEEGDYRSAALDDAREALSLVRRLRRGAARLGVSAELESTREMIESYAERLERVRELSASGRDPGFVDERVRFDDAPALDEVRALVGALERTVDERLRGLARQGALTDGLATGATAALGLGCIALVRRRGRRHALAIEELVAGLSQSNAELERANVSLSQFAGVVSHDLKSPLRHVELATAMMVEEVDDREAFDECAEIVRRSVVRMDLIVDALLDFTKTGFTEPRDETVEVAGFLERTCEEIRGQDRARGARLELECALEPGTGVRADPALLERVLSNLVGNGLKYAREGEAARVRVRVEPAGDALAFSVEDDGIGIDPRFADRIFEPLERLHPPGDRYGGVGIGLSLARSVVEGHGGELRLDTDRAGGARFTFTLPADRVVAPRAPEAST